MNVKNKDGMSKLVNNSGLRKISERVKKEVVTFEVNAVYGVLQVSRIIDRSERMVRELCARKVLKSHCDKRGYLITGWAIRDYCEGRCELQK